MVALRTALCLLFAGVLMGGAVRSLAQSDSFPPRALRAKLFLKRVGRAHLRAACQPRRFQEFYRFRYRMPSIVDCDKISGFCFRAPTCVPRVDNAESS